MLGTEAGIRTLVADGLHTDEETVRGILDAGEEAFPRLARVATYDEYWRASNGWAPICAIHLLAEIGHCRAPLAINTAILDHHGETGDWLTEEAPYVLARMGAGAVPATTALMRHVDTDAYVRLAAAGALIITASKHPEAKPGIVASIKDAAHREADDTMKMMLVDSLLDLRDPDLYEYLRDAVETGFIPRDFYDVPTLDDVYEGRLRTSITSRQVEPLSIFSYHPGHRYGPGGPVDMFGDLWLGGPVDVNENRKTGRNEPCPCGSGKKYKKCCKPKT